MPKVERCFRFVLGLSFLPESARRFLFDTGTRAMEVLNALFLAAWSVVLFADGQVILLQKKGNLVVFSGAWMHYFWGSVFTCAALFAVVGMAYKGTRCRVLGGYALLLGALIWALIAAGFATHYPPLNTAIFIYASMSALCFFSGEHVMYLERQRAAQEQQESGGRHVVRLSD